MIPTRRWRRSLWLLCAWASATSAGLPDGAPAEQLLFDSNRQEAGDPVQNYEIYSLRVDGSAPRRLTHDDRHDSWWPRPSPDHRRILFVRTPAGVHDRDYRQVSTWVMNADGSELREILPRGAHGWGIQGHPEWSPDGRRIATMGGRAANAQIYIVRADGSAPAKVTGGAQGPDRGGMNLDPSWSPDGSKLLFIGCRMATRSPGCGTPAVAAPCAGASSGWQPTAVPRRL